MPKTQQKATRSSQSGAASGTRKRSYTEDDIQVLEGLDAVRKRPGMYIGGTGSAALSHLLWELIDNAVDEAADGHATRVDVVAHSDGSWSVMDDGRGIPIGKHRGGHRSTVEVIFTELHAGGKFGTNAYGAAGGLHGVGASVVNALSTRVRIEVAKGSIHRLDFVERIAGQFDDKSGRFTAGHAMKRVGKSPAGQTGTTVRFWPDMEMFSSDAAIDWEEVGERLRRTAWLVKGVTFSLTDEAGEREPMTAVAERGLLDALEFLTGGAETLCNPIACVADHSFTQRVPGPDGKELVDIVRPCHVEVVMQWTAAESEPSVASFVNTIPTPEGGTHMTGFERAVSNEIRDQIKGQRKLNKLSKLSKLKGATAQREDAMAGLVAVVRAIIPEPQFHGQTKRELGTPEATEMVQTTVREALGDWFAGKVKGSYKSHINAVLNHVAEAMLSRHAAADAAAAHRKARKAANGALPSKLTDCRNHPGGELLIVEGDSAAGPAKRARDVGWQAVLPLRGKPINAATSRESAVLANAEASALLTAFGAGAGKHFDLDAARYDRLVLLADADVDGSHIRCLVLTLLWHQMRPLLEAGRVYAAQPPTHAVTLESSGDKTFVYSEQALEEHCAVLDKANRRYRVTRFKGLGEMNDDELSSTTLDPKTRVLRRISADDAEACAASVDVLMGADSGARREFIFEHSSAYGHALDV